jgi:hypothetical protein
MINQDNILEVYMMFKLIRHHEDVESFIGPEIPEPTRCIICGDKKHQDNIYFCEKHHEIICGIEYGLFDNLLYSDLSTFSKFKKNIMLAKFNDY